MTIDLNLSSDQNQIVASVSKVLADLFPLSRLRGDRSGPSDASRLRALADIGAFGLGTPEDLGGTGFSIVEDMLLFTEFGRHLVTPNALAATLAARLSGALGLPDTAAEIISGNTGVCVANATRPFHIDALDGVPLHLLDWQDTSLALLWNDRGIALLDSRGLEAVRLAPTDRSVSLHQCELPRSTVLGSLSSAHSTLARQANLLLAAMLLGMAEATRDMAVEYAKIRMQFGQPIGAFQAVKHRCANMAIQAQALKAQLAFSAIAERDAWPDAALQIDAARMLATRCALVNAGANIQIHGGIGFTAECDAHLFVLRAHLYEHLGGSLGGARARLASPSASGPVPEYVPGLQPQGVV